MVGRLLMLRKPKIGKYYDYGDISPFYCVALLSLLLILYNVLMKPMWQRLVGPRDVGREAIQRRLPTLTNSQVLASYQPQPDLCERCQCAIANGLYGTKNMAGEPQETSMNKAEAVWKLHQKNERDVQREMRESRLANEAKKRKAGYPSFCKLRKCGSEPDDDGRPRLGCRQKHAISGKYKGDKEPYVMARDAAHLRALKSGAKDKLDDDQKRRDLLIARRKDPYKGC